MGKGRATGAPPAAPSGTDPHPQYAALDRNTLPFHAGSGAWGAQVPLQGANPPVITRTVTVTSTVQANTEAATPGTRIIMDYDTTSGVLIQGSFSDLDIVIPSGRSLGAFTIGTYSVDASLQRIRIRGDTVGTYSGGSLASIEFLANVKEDYIIDGVSCRGGVVTSLWYDGGGHAPYPTVTRSAIVNCRFHSEQAVALWYSDHCLWAGNCFSSGVNYSPIPGSDESWDVRSRGAPFVHYDNDFRGTKFHRTRHAPHYERTSLPPEYLYIANNRYVDLHEARIFAIFPDSLNASTDTLAGVWFVNNTVYAENGTGETTPSMDAVKVSNYARFINNTFYGDFTQSMLNSSSSVSEATSKDFATGNTFSAIAAIPAYTRAGDPNVIPLPYMAFTIVEEFTFKPVSTLSITVTTSTAPGTSGQVLFGSYRDRGSLTDPSVYPMRKLISNSATSTVITSVPAGIKYIRPCPYTGSTFGTPGAQASYTPA